MRAVSCEKAQDRRESPPRQVRILYIVTAFPRWPGDVITPWLVETIERLREEWGVEVEVLAPGYRGMGDQVYEGIRVHRYRYAPARLERLTHDQTTPDRLRERPWYLGLVPTYVAAGTAAAVRLARGSRFDVVHSFWPLPHGLFGHAAARAAGIPHVTTFFGVELTWLRRQLPFLAPVVRAIVRRSDAATVISSHTARELRRVAPGSRIRTIPFGAALKPDAGGERAAERSGDGPFQLLFVGRLVERKGVSVLLRALAQLGSDREVHATVVGEGPLASALKREAEELGLGPRVTFTGSVTEQELGRLYGSCDAFVLPAIEDSKGDVEGLGVVLIEALLHRLPVIASESGGIPDIVRNGETGLLVEPGEPAALADAVRRLMDEAGLGAALARAGHAHVERRFSWPVILASLVELYGEVVEERRSRSAGSPRREGVGGG
jgi:glycosyltransferase involved in cell wall biosynthesis